MKLFLVFCGIVCVVLAADSRADRFKEFRKKHSKKYKDAAEEKLREARFLKNMKSIDDHNLKYSAGLATFKKGVNRFTDLSHDELVKKHTGYIPPKVNPDGTVAGDNGPSIQARARTTTTTAPTTTTPSLPTLPLPANFDWRTSGSVSPVKDQGECGSCWSFAATGALESRNYIKNKKMVILSEQNLIDCTLTSPYNNFGCDGGSTGSAFKYIQNNNGDATQASYPYLGVTGTTCKAQSSIIGATLTGFSRILAKDENAIKNIVATVGPVAVALYTSDAFMDYQSGIYSEINCSTAVNHAVLIVGYGTTNGKDYWIIKNSWGKDWGVGGYMQISRGVNMCGIALWATYPLL